MKIICLVKFTPDVENFAYDYEKNVLVRENVRLILNPDDASALAFALRIKNKLPDTFVEIVTMAPKSVIPYLEDLLRLHADKATLISDKLYIGSDTYITSRILGKYLSGVSFDCILTGTSALDGDTSHVPAQLGEILNICQMSNVADIEEESFGSGSTVIKVEEEKVFAKYRISMPAILSLQKERKYKLPYIKYEDLERNVKDRIQIIDNETLGFEPDEAGISGSLTQVSGTFVKRMKKKDKLIVKNDSEGIDTVYTFLKEKGFI
jgi:electron transfer flavoprotein beta subunit